MSHGMHDQRQEHEDAGFYDQDQDQGFPEDLDHDLSNAGHSIENGFKHVGNGVEHAGESIEHDFEHLGYDADQLFEQHPNEQYGDEQGYHGQHSMQQDPYGMHDGDEMQNGHGMNGGHGTQHAQMGHDECGGQSNHDQHHGGMEGHGGHGGYGEDAEDEHGGYGYEEGHGGGW